jgi:HemY protein
LLLVLGRFCLQKQLWGKAQSYFEASLSLKPSRAAHIALAKLLDQLEQPALATKHFRAAALLP